MKTGLVLEGGAMRGMFTAGVLDVMMENDIEADGVIGVSAGATFGCNYNSRQIGRTLRYNLKYCDDYRYGSFRSVFKSGDIYDVKLCYEDIPLKLDKFDDETFQELAIPFYCVCTDAETGEPVYRLCRTGTGEDLQWIRASATIPVVSRVVEIGDRKLLDGGISDPIPIRQFESMGYDRNIVVLTRPYDYVKEKNSMMIAVRAALRKYPETVKAIANRHRIYNATTDYIKVREKEGNALVLRPLEPLDIKSTESNPEKIQKAYAHGRAVAEMNLEKLKKFTEED